MNYSFHPVAEVELLDSITYYETKNVGLGAAYLAEFESIMLEVLESPKRNPIELKPYVRRKIMRRFPFNILYRIVDSEIQVLAIAHHRRRPNYWLGRL